MGIPFYFSYIVKNHANIIKKLSQTKIHHETNWSEFDRIRKKGGSNLHVNNLYMDCNSIIYDIVHTMKFDEITESIFVSIIKQVISKIESYIQIVQPDQLVYIAFDGVAPVAKLDQQRDRRFKSAYQSNLSKLVLKTSAVDPFNTAAITPGTPFMHELNRRIQSHFGPPACAARFHVKRIVVSGSDVPGEGEHKLFAHVRDNASSGGCQETHLVYGLDADLIMLSINHLPICPRIYLFRETPEFIRSLDASLEPHAHYYLDIPELTQVITEEMNTGKDKDRSLNRVYDYIFLCFFLGNDFLPHFPAINIRTGGVDKMINAYKATVGSTQAVLYDGQTIHWGQVRLLVEFLVQQEEKYIREEVKLRDKRGRKFWPEKTPEEILIKFENTPTYERDLEKFVDPQKEGWQTRYYQALFQVEITDPIKKDICTNYLEGLEWTMKYYTTGCPDWRWSYKYNYPPLLEDLIHYVPCFEKTFVPVQPENPVSPLVQLSYVLPAASLSMLPEALHKELVRLRPEWYPRECEFYWAFCKYFWESHVDLPSIDMEELEAIVKKI